MEDRREGLNETNEGKTSPKEENEKENNEEVQNKKIVDKEPLKFFVQIGDCTPQIYNLMIAFNPNIEYDKLNVDEKFFRGLVEDTNVALVPVLEKYIKILKG